MKIITLLLAFATLPILAQVPEDHSTEKKHKETYERSTFYKLDSTGKVVPCGILAEWKNGQWKAFRDGIGVTFDTRDVAVKWLKVYCPIDGTK